jgi:two-component system, NarL family, sensor histidine kinase DesK
VKRVTNVMRHSRARHCEIVLRHVEGEVTLEIRNDAGGPARAISSAAAVEGRPGGGLRGLDERVRALGGVSESGPLPQGGFHLAVTIPTAAAPPAVRETSSLAHTTVEAQAPATPLPGERA